jgi:hypothetical protein
LLPWAQAERLNYQSDPRTGWINMLWGYGGTDIDRQPRNRSVATIGADVQPAMEPADAQAEAARATK